MPLVFPRTRPRTPARASRAAGVLAAVCVVVLSAGAVVGVREGRAPGLLPERSWGPWTDGGIEGWSTHVRVNRWGDAAEADIHFGKAEDLTLHAYGKTVSATSMMEPTVFTLTPDGRLTARRLPAP
ncbi:hypothetical protein ACFXA3_17035 [Streptomyces sp. NPDC059456]|uniref:hypothetical protein n=1 Tax=Streptomyces sp. NPDC059456 TaxID=3346838 RepID=UPI003688A4AC